MGQKRCSKCRERKKLTRHHIFGKHGYRTLRYNSKLPLLIYLAWAGRQHDEVTILFWEKKITHLCRVCHDEFHILFTRLIKECDATQSGMPIRNYLEEKNVERMG